MNTVPKWFWLVVTVFIVFAAIRFLHFPVFILIIAFFWGYGPLMQWFRREFLNDDTPPRQRHHRRDWQGRRDRADRPPVRWGENSTDPRPSPTLDSVADPELRDLLIRGHELAVQLRGSLAGARDQQVRQRVTGLSEDADRILTGLRDRGDVTLARSFVEKYLTPAATIMTSYTRLTGRGMTSARPVLDRVETHDLPLLQKRYGEFYESLHRGDLIELEVASEMLAFELDEPVNGAPALTEADGEPNPAAVRWSERDAAVSAGGHGSDER